MRSLIALAFCSLLTGCIGARQVAASTRVEYGNYHGDMNPDNGVKDYDNDGYYVGVSIAPLAFLEPPREVIVVRPDPKTPK